MPRQDVSSSRLKQVKVLNIIKESLLKTISDSYSGGDGAKHIEGDQDMSVSGCFRKINTSAGRRDRTGGLKMHGSGKLRKIYAAAAVFLAAFMVMALPVRTYAAIGGNSAPLIDNRKLEDWPSERAPELDCVSAYAVEAQSGTVVFSKAGDRSMHPASITKVMTALIVIENCGLDEMVTFESQDVDHLESGGNNFAIKWKGETLSVRDCLYALLLESVNECGMALARHTSGSVDAFCALMNQRAIDIGCTGTHFTNPHGLNDEAHITTARDMVLIFRECLRNETFYEIASALRYKIAGTALNPNGLSCYNHDRMMRPDSDHYDEHVIAGKTGYTSICGNTLLTYAEKDGMQLLICLLKGSSAANNYRDTKRVMNYATENFVISDMEPLSNDFAKGLVTRAGLRLGVDGNGKLFVPKSYEGNMHFYYYPSPDAPNYVDGWVGTIFYRINGQTISTMRVVDIGPALTGTEDEITTESFQDTEDETDSGAVEKVSGLAGPIDVTRDASEGQGQDKNADTQNTDADAQNKDADAQNTDTKKQEADKAGHGIEGWVKKVLLVILILILLFAIFVLERYIRYRRRQRERKRRREERRRRQMEARKKEEERLAAEKALESAILKAIAQTRKDDDDPGETGQADGLDDTFSEDETGAGLAEKQTDESSTGRQGETITDDEA